MTMLLAAFIQNAGGLFSLRKDFQLREAAGPALIRLAFIP